MLLSVGLVALPRMKEFQPGYEPRSPWDKGGGSGHRGSKCPIGLRVRRAHEKRGRK